MSFIPFICIEFPKTHSTPSCCKEKLPKSKSFHPNGLPSDDAEFIASPQSAGPASFKFRFHYVTEKRDRRMWASNECGADLSVVPICAFCGGYSESSVLRVAYNFDRFLKSQVCKNLSRRAPRTIGRSNILNVRCHNSLKVLLFIKQNQEVG